MSNPFFTDVLPRSSNGLQASGVIPFTIRPTAADVITIDGFTFVFGPNADFNGADQFGAASSLATKINRNQPPVASGVPGIAYRFFAYAVGPNLYIVARQTGVAGNSIAMSGTAAGGAFTVPATLTGGVNGGTVAASASGSALVVTAGSAYTAGNVVGGLLTFAGATGGNLTGLLQSIRLKLKSVQTGAFKLTLFRALPATVFTDKTAPNLVVADVALVLGTFSLSANDSTLGTYTIYILNAIMEVLRSVGGTSLYGVLTCVGTPTFTATTDVVDVTLGIVQD